MRSAFTEDEEHMQVSAPIPAHIEGITASVTPSPSASRVPNTAVSLAAPTAPSAAVRPARMTATPAPQQSVSGVLHLGATKDAPGPKTPDWSKTTQWYQVFTDRFQDGDPSNNPAGTIPFGSPPGNFTFQGGDLEGVTQRIPYLKALGIKGIYLSPEFVSPSNHKYDNVDPTHVDPHFGGDAALKTLIDTAHQHGMKVMLDGAFNNTSNQAPQFQDVLKNGPKSKFWNWYSVSHWPITTTTDANGVLRTNDYAAWGGPGEQGYATLPVLNKSNPEVQKFFVDGPDSVVAKWIGFGADGWRMDVAQDPSMPANWATLERNTIKAANPNALLVAEAWQDDSAQLQGNQFDSAMNYNYFLWPAVDFFAKKDISPDQFIQRLQNGYGAEAKQSMLNSLDTHDTARFITQAGGDWYRLRPAAIFQETYVGAPTIYYGDEVAQEGGTDPDSRRAMPWDRVDPKLLGPNPPKPGFVDPQSTEPNYVQTMDLYRKLIATRTANPVLSSPNIDWLSTHDDNHTMSYRRYIPGQTKDAIVAINNDTVAHGITIPTSGVAPDGTKYTDALTGTTYSTAAGQLVIPNMVGNFGAVLLRSA